MLVSCHCSVPPPHLAIGASMSYLWDSSWLFKDKGPLMVFTWEQVSKCQFQQFIFHVRIEMSHPSIMSTPALRVFRIEYISVLVKITRQTKWLQVEVYPNKAITGASHVGRLSSSGQKGKQFSSVCVNERIAFGKCQQLKRNQDIYFHAEFKPGELANYPWTITWFCVRAKMGQ